MKRAKAQEEERKRKEKEESSAQKVIEEVDEEMLELEKQFFAATRTS